LREKERIGKAKEKAVGPSQGHRNTTHFCSKGNLQAIRAKVGEI
jgi:hypothetical protein